MSFRKVSHLISNTPLLVFLFIILGIYLIGLISQQHILIRNIELSKDGEMRYKNEIATLKKEIAAQNKFFIPDRSNNCLKKPYTPEKYVISSTRETVWCNVRVFTSANSGFDILFPSIATIEFRGDLAVFDDRSDTGITLFTVHEAMAEDKTVNSYDSITERKGNNSLKLINDPIVNKKIITVQETPVLFLTTKDVAGRTMEHYIFDNGRTKDKKVYRVTFYKQLADSDKEIILNSFAPRF